MKRMMLFVIAGLLILFARNAIAQTKEPSLPEIARLTKQIIKANPQFSNPDIVYPGDKVRVVEEGKATVYTVGKWAHGSKDGCLWQIANLHLQKKLEQAQANVLPANNQATKTEIVPEEKVVPRIKNQLPETRINWQLFLSALQVIFAILTFLLLIYLIYILKKHWADKYLPVIPDGLPRDPAEAFGLLAENYPRLLDAENGDPDGKHITEISRGHLFQHFGVKAIKVQMAFENGIHNVRIVKNDLVHRATYSDGSVFYFRSRCGNMYVSDNNEPFQFPEGWVFVPEVSAEFVPKVAAEKEEI